MTVMKTRRIFLGKIASKLWANTSRNYISHTSEHVTTENMNKKSMTPSTRFLFVYYLSRSRDFHHRREAIHLKTNNKPTI